MVKNRYEFLGKRVYSPKLIDNLELSLKPVYRCVLCNRTFKTRKEMERHLTSQHLD